MRHFDRLLEGPWEMHMWFVFSERVRRDVYFLCEPGGRWTQVFPEQYDEVVEQLYTDPEYRQRIALYHYEKGTRSSW